MSDHPGKRPTIGSTYTGKEAISKSGLKTDMMLHKDGSHHGNIRQREKQGADDAEHQCLSHGFEILSFNAGECKDREENDENDKYRESRAGDYLGRTTAYFFIHLFLRKGSVSQSTGEKVCHDSFHNHDRTVYHNTKVDSTQTHQVSRHAKDPHQDKPEEHRKRNDRRHNDTCTHIA